MGRAHHSKHHRHGKWVRAAANLAYHAASSYGRGYLHAAGRRHGSRGGEKDTDGRQESNIGVGGTWSRKFIRCGRMYKKLSRLEDALSTKGKYTDSVGTRISSSTNTQNFTSFGYYLTADIVNMMKALGGTTPIATQGLFLKKMEGTLQILNQENATVTVYLYDMQARYDYQGFSPSQDWIDGCNDETNANYYSYPFTTPFASKKFCERWKVLGRKKISLSSGGIHTHKVIMRPMHKINYERITSTGSSTELGATSCVGRLTSCTMVVIVGSVCNDASTKTNVGYGPAAVDVILNTNYAWAGLPQDETVLSRAGTLGGLTTSEYMNEKTGLVVSDTAA